VTFAPVLADLAVRLAPAAEGQKGLQPMGFAIMSTT
jgi:hypothetical protein